MSDDERFEEYLRTFQAPEPPETIVRRAKMRAHRHRIAAWCVRGTGIALAAAACLLFILHYGPALYAPAVQAPRIPLRARADETSLSEMVSRGSLIMAYAQGGSDALGAQLDDAGRHFVPETESMGIALPLRQ